MDIENYFILDDFSTSLMSLKKLFEEGDLSNNIDLIGYFIDIAIKYSIILREKDGLYTIGLNEFIKNVADYV